MRRREVIKLAVSSTLTAMLLDTESKKITSTATRVSARKSVAFYAIEVTQMLIPEAYSCYP